MTFEIILTLFFAVALLAVKPGPGMITVASKAIGEGLPDAIHFMLGTSVAKLVFFSLLVFGYSFLPERDLVMTIILKVVAAFYLIWLGVRGFKKLEAAIIANEFALNKKGFGENFSAGFVLTISNPFDIAFFAGVLPSVLKVEQVSASDFILCAITIILVFLLVALSYAVPIALSRQFLPRGLVRKLNIVSSAGLIVVGIIIGISILPVKNILLGF